MNWRWTWARAQLTAVTTSAVVWLMTGTLAPVAAGTALVVGIVLVAGWRSRPMLWWRFGTRAMGGAGAGSLWRALVPVEWLRGRNQPRLWIGRRVTSDMVATGPCDLILSERLLHRLTQQQVSDADLCRLAVRALELAEVNQSRLVASVEVFCLPWSLLAVMVRAACRPAASMRLVGFAWRLRWLFVGRAAVDLYGRADWPGLVMLLLAAAATITTPRWNRAWAQRKVVMADAAEKRLTANLGGMSPPQGDPESTGEHRSMLPVTRPGDAR